MLRGVVYMTKSSGPRTEPWGTMMWMDERVCVGYVWVNIFLVTLMICMQEMRILCGKAV